MSLRRVSPAEADRLVKEEGYQYIDVRTEAEFVAGHPDGAENIPIMLSGGGGMVPNPDFKRVVQANHATDARIVVGCKMGGRSLKAANELIAAGFTNVVDQFAGYDGSKNSFGQVVEKGWRDAGLATSTSPNSGKSYAELKGRA
jgi:rhodanese-related sulfurtransferase